MNRKCALNIYGLVCCERSTLIRQTDVKLSEGTFSSAQHPYATDHTSATLDRKPNILATGPLASDCELLCLYMCVVLRASKWFSHWESGGKGIFGGCTDDWKKSRSRVEWILTMWGEEENGRKSKGDTISKVKCKAQEELVTDRKEKKSKLCLSRKLVGHTQI